MATSHPIEALLRPAVEFNTTAVCWASAALCLWAPWSLALTPSVGYGLAAGFAAFGLWRFRQGWRILQYRRSMKRLPRFARRADQIPVSPRLLWLGKGFRWEALHTRRLYEAQQPEARPYLQPNAVYRGPAVANAIARPDVQQNRLPERRAGVCHADTGDISQLRIQPDVVEIEQSRVFLFQLQGSFFPGPHLAQFGAQLLVLFGQALIALEVTHQVYDAGDGNHGPLHIGHHRIHHLRAKPLDSWTVDAPDDEDDREKQHQNPDKQTLERACIVFAL